MFIFQSWQHQGKLLLSSAWLRCLSLSFPWEQRMILLRILSLPGPGQPEAGTRSCLHHHRPAWARSCSLAEVFAENISLLSSSSSAGTLDSVLLKGLNLSSWYIWCCYLGHGTALLLGDGPALLGHGVHILGLPHRVLLSPAAGGRHWGRGGDRHYGGYLFTKQRHFLEGWLIFFHQA